MGRELFFLLMFIFTETDDPEVFRGAPLAVQIIGRRLEEEKLLASATEIKRCLE